MYTGHVYCTCILDYCNTCTCTYIILSTNNYTRPCFSVVLLEFVFLGTIEKLNTLEVLAEDSMIFHHLHKRVWPSTQRETVFLSHHCVLDGEPRPNNMIGHSHLVCNFSIDVPSTPVSSNKETTPTLY